jgi:ketosteroid isomerase-like protein
MIMSTQQSAQDEAEIRALLARYVRGVDRADIEMIKSCFHPDATENHGPFQGSGIEFAERPSRKTLATRSMHHLLGQTLLEIDGDTAQSETYFSCSLVRRKSEDDPYRFVEAWGRYVDRIERRDSGRWLIARRRVVMDHTRESELGQLWTDEAAYLAGSRYPTDPVYQLE